MFAEILHVINIVNICKYRLFIAKTSQRFSFVAYGLHTFRTSFHNRDTIITLSQLIDLFHSTSPSPTWRCPRRTWRRWDMLDGKMGAPWHETVARSRTLAPSYITTTGGDDDGGSGDVVRLCNPRNPWHERRDPSNYFRHRASGNGRKNLAIDYL